jgi:ATP-dependent DNA helicase RecG
VYVRWQHERLTVSNPGGFVDGVSLDNLLVVEPRPRNPLLADAFKRIGLAERTGRGVDLIFQGLLRYGRPAPSYRRSDATSVVVELSCADADRDFLKLVIDEEQRLGTSIPVDTLLVLSRLREEKRLDAAALPQTLQKDLASARAVVERLVEAGLAEAHGIKQGRTYTMSPQLYCRLGEPAGYIRQAGFDPLQQEQMVRSFVREHGRINRAGAAELCRISLDQAKRLLAKLVDEDVLARKGVGRATHYERGANL